MQNAMMAVCLLRRIFYALLTSLRNSPIVSMHRACSSLQQQRTAPSSLPATAKRDGMERSKGDTTRRLGSVRQMSPWSKFERDHETNEIYTTDTSTACLYTVAGVRAAWRSKLDLDHPHNNNNTHRPAWRHWLCVFPPIVRYIVR